MPNSNLPIEQIIPELKSALNAHACCVLQAEPGAGKTTRVPIALLEESWLKGQRILMLEPRRLATQGAATYMANSLNQAVGETVGYRIRGESKVKQSTRIEVVTEGILTRYLQRDPELQGIGLVIFDEFHERGLHSDLGLALCLESQRSVREDLRLLVMSATLDTDSVAALMSNAPILHCPGRQYPVTVHYNDRQAEGRIEHQAASCIRGSLRQDSGDILVFLPGKAEIIRTEEQLRLKSLGENVVIFPLYSELGYDAQRSALTPLAAGTRKVILSTSIAETSLTIDGVRIVIDSGLMRVPRYDSSRGMSGLETVQVSKSSADQRKGRAGRQAPGVCYRLWTEATQHNLSPFGTPEILSSDLTPMALDLAEWGTLDASKLAFLDPPSTSSIQQARELLRTLGAIDSNGRITAHGKEMNQLAVHPRLAHMILKGKQFSAPRLACDLAALLEERDLLRDGRQQEISLSIRCQILDDFRIHNRCSSASKFTLQRVCRQSDRLIKLLSAPETDRDEISIGMLLAFAFPDRIAMSRGNDSRHYLLANGGGAELPAHSLLHHSKFLVICELDAAKAHARVFLAESIEEIELRKYFQDQLSWERRVFWSEEDGSVKSLEHLKLGAILLNEKTIEADGEEVQACLIAAIRAAGINALPWTKTGAAFKERASWLSQSGYAGSDWPDFTDLGLLNSLEEWLSPFLNSSRSMREVARLDLTQALESRLSWKQKAELDRLAPSHLDLPSGSRVPVHYDRGEIPFLSILLQEMFGQRETPRVADGKLAVTVELLSPARRPLQVTRDLESFWSNAYQSVRKEMQGRYPRHRWPSDPLSAPPSGKPQRRRF